MTSFAVAELTTTRETAGATMHQMPLRQDQHRSRRCLSPAERRKRQLASKIRWADRNRDQVRAKIRELCRLPRYLEAKRRRYALKRQERLDSGWVPNPRGRPRLQFADDEEGTAYFKRRAHERYVARKMARSKESVDDA